MNKLKVFTILIGVLFFAETTTLMYFIYKSQGLSKKLESLKPSYEKLSKKESELKSKYADLLKENEALKEDRKNLLSQAKNLLDAGSRAQELASSLEKANSDTAQLQKENQDLKNNNAILQEQLKNLQDEQAKITKEMDDLKVAYDKAKKDTLVKELRIGLANLQKEKNIVDKNFKHADLTMVKLKEQVTRLESEKEKLSEQLKDYRRNYSDALKKNKKLEQEARNIPAKFSEIARQNKVLIRQTAEMHYNLGVFYTKNKEYERAIAEFEKVVEIDPNDSYAHFNLGYIYAEYLVNRKKAIKHFRHYLGLAKSDDKDIDWVKKYLLTWETYEGRASMK